MKLNDKYAILESIGYVIVTAGALVLAFTYLGASLANLDTAPMRILVNHKGLVFWCTLVILLGGVCIRVGYAKK